MVLNAGMQLGDYRILRHLGRGGMGDVYLAEHSLMGVPYAVKTLREEFAGLHGFRERFLTEAQVMAKLHHPHIVRVNNMGEEAELKAYYLVLDYVEGPNGTPETLEQRLNAREGRLRIDETAAVARQIGGAVSLAHGRSVLHRDIKPGNILFNRENQCLLSDFGLAKMVGEESLIASIDKSVSIGLQRSRAGIKGAADPSLGSDETAGVSSEVEALVGTFHYMAPEVKDGQSATERSDLFSLAVVLYRCLTGRRPRMRYKDPSKIDGSISPAWDHALGKAMEDEPGDRQESIEEFLEDLRGVIGADGISRISIAGATMGTGDEDALRESEEAWSFAERFSGRPNDGDIQECINDLTDSGIVGGGKLTRAQAQSVLRSVCEKWLIEDRKRREREAWEKVREADHPQRPSDSKMAYEDFLKAFPDGAHAKQAQGRVEELTRWLEEEQKAWRTVEKEKTLAAYRSYAEKYVVGGLYLAEARAEIERLEKEEADRNRDEELWNEACEQNTVEAYRHYLSESPTKSRAEEAESKVVELLDAAARKQDEELWAEAAGSEYSRII